MDLEAFEFHVRSTYRQLEVETCTSLPPESARSGDTGDGDGIATADTGRSCAESHQRPRMTTSAQHLSDRDRCLHAGDTVSEASSSQTPRDGTQETYEKCSEVLAM